MPTHLEPIFLANILLHVQDVHTIKSFPFISKNCQVATLTLKTNPAAFSDLPSSHILTYFPNINTLVLRFLSLMKEEDSLPDTVTSIIVECMNFNDLTPAQLRYADRVVEIQSEFSTTSPADFSLFPRLERLSLHGIPKKLTLPKQTLKHLRVHSLKWNTKSPMTIFPPKCAEQIVIVYESRKVFAKATAKRHPPNVRLFCSEIGEGVDPAAFFPWEVLTNNITLSAGFGADELRAFDEALPVPFTHATLQSTAKLKTCDISFLTGMTKLDVRDVKGCTLRLPARLANLTLFDTTGRLTVSNTENLTHLENRSKTNKLTACPSLREFVWYGAAFSMKAVPFPFEDTLSLESLSLGGNSIAPNCVLPAGLTELRLRLNESVDVSTLRHMTRLNTLFLEFSSDSTPLDLSELTSLTRVDANQSPIACLPTSLVECRLQLETDFDFSGLTLLTRLQVAFMAKVRVTFPTQLKELIVGIGEETLGESNVADVALEAFTDHCLPLTREVLLGLPKTLRTIGRHFDPPSLAKELPTIFPLFAGKVVA